MKDFSLSGLKVSLLGIPLLLFSAIILVAVIGFRIAFSQITSLRDSLAVASKNENILKEKATVLSEVGQTALAGANTATAALPSENSSLLILYQLRNLAANNNIPLSNVKVGSGSKDANGLSAVDISFDITGNLPQIFDSVNTLKALAPVTVLKSVELNLAGGSTQATISLRGFWSAFPTKIPKLTDPITDLNAVEKQTLSQISNLSAPPFVTLSPNPAAPRDNPFGI